MLAIGGILTFVGFICYIIILVHAFKDSVAQGFLSLCVPFYVFYFMFAKLQSDKKGLLIGGFLGGYIIGYALMIAGGLLEVTPQ